MRRLVARASEPAGLRTVASLVWTVVLVAALVGFVLRDPGGLRAALGLFRPVAVLTSALLILLAKLLLAEIFGVVARSEGVPLSPYERQRTYHLSQLAKYLPGFVWQFASKGYLLQRQGAPPAIAARVIAAEQVWIIGGAAVVGIVAATAAVPVVAMDVGLLTGPWGEAPRTLFAVFAAFALLGVAILRRRGGWVARRRLVGLSLAAWVALSLSFAVLVASVGGVHVSSLLIGGAAFPIAYIGGYVAPFAPGGIGVREGLLAALLTPILETEVAAAVAVMSRLVYLTVEVVLSTGLSRSRRA